MHGWSKSRIDLWGVFLVGGNIYNSFMCAINHSLVWKYGRPPKGVWESYALNIPNDKARNAFFLSFVGWLLFYYHGDHIMKLSVPAFIVFPVPNLCFSWQLFWEWNLGICQSYNRPIWHVLAFFAYSLSDLLLCGTVVVSLNQFKPFFLYFMRIKNS